jgi:hypothetical protein
MDQRPAQPTQRRRLRRIAIPICALLIVLALGYLLYEYSPIGWIYYMLRANYFRHRAEALEPAYDKLNETLLQSLPVYPEATPLPQTQVRQGVGQRAPGGPVGSTTLRRCFSTDDSVDQVGEFYENALGKEGWKSVRKQVDKYGHFFYQIYAKDQACIDLGGYCDAHFERETKTVYQIEVSHDLNMLLGFPDIPRIVYWTGEVERCR